MLIEITSFTHYALFLEWARKRYELRMQHSDTDIAWLFKDSVVGKCVDNIKDTSTREVTFWVDKRLYDMWYAKGGFMSDKTVGSYESELVTGNHKGTLVSLDKEKYHAFAAWAVKMYKLRYHSVSLGVQWRFHQRVICGWEGTHIEDGFKNITYWVDEGLYKLWADADGDLISDAVAYYTLRTTKGTLVQEN